MPRSHEITYEWRDRAPVGLANKRPTTDADWGAASLRERRAFIHDVCLNESTKPRVENVVISATRVAPSLNAVIR